MKTQLTVNNIGVPLNDFTQRYIGNILKSIALTLGTESTMITVSIEPDNLRIFADSGEITVKKDFVKQIVESTIKGVLSPLKGIFWLERITITTTS